MSSKNLASLFVFLVIVGWGGITPARAAFVVPTLTSPVEDLADMMTSQDEKSLRQLIREFKSQNKAQFQVLTVPTLHGLTIEQAALQVVDQWKVGDTQRDDGVLFLIAAKERKIRIEVGQGLEGILTDIATKRIIEDVMVPVFRQASPSEGILVGVYQGMKLVDPKFHASGSSQDEYAPVQAPVKVREIVIFLIVFILFLIFSRFTGGGGGRRLRRGGFIGGMGGGFGGGGFGGGGGWSGGGGGFSGGGSSGSW